MPKTEAKPIETPQTEEQIKQSLNKNIMKKFKKSVTPQQVNQVKDEEEGAMHTVQAPNNDVKVSQESLATIKVFDKHPKQLI